MCGSLFFSYNSKAKRGTYVSQKALRRVRTENPHMYGEGIDKDLKDILDNKILEDLRGFINGG